MYKEYFHLETWPRTGLPLCGILQPTLKEVPHYEVPHGSYLHFKESPIELLPDCVMMNFLKARDIAPKGNPSCHRLIKLMKDVKYQEEMAPRPKSLSQVFEGKSW